MISRGGGLVTAPSLGGRGVQKSARDHHGISGRSQRPNTRKNGTVQGNEGIGVGVEYGRFWNLNGELQPVSEERSAESSFG